MLCHRSLNTAHNKRCNRATIRSSMMVQRSLSSRGLQVGRKAPSIFFFFFPNLSLSDRHPTLFKKLLQCNRNDGGCCSTHSAKFRNSSKNVCTCTRVVSWMDDRNDVRTSFCLFFNSIKDLKKIQKTLKSSTQTNKMSASLVAVIVGTMVAFATAGDDLNPWTAEEVTGHHYY